MALNDGFAIDGQGRRIYFPPIGQPRLVSTREDEARFNGIVHTYGLIAFGMFILCLFGFWILSAKDLFEIDANTLILSLLVLLLAVRFASASLHARRWPTLNDSKFTYHRFVVSTLSLQSSVWPRCKLLVSSIVAIGVVAFTGWALVKLQTEWAIVDPRKNAERLLVIPIPLAIVPFCVVYAYRVRAALRRRRTRQSLSS